MLKNYYLDVLQEALLNALKQVRDAFNVLHAFYEPRWLDLDNPRRFIRLSRSIRTLFESYHGFKTPLISSLLLVERTEKDRSGWLSKVKAVQRSKTKMREARLCVALRWEIVILSYRDLRCPRATPLARRNTEMALERTGESRLRLVADA